MRTELKQIAARCDLLRGLTPTACEAVLAEARLQEIPAGTTLFYQDDPATRLYILIEGQLRLTQLTPEGHQVIVHHAMPGEGIGIIVALSYMPYPISAETLTDSVVLSWDAETTRRLMHDHPQMAINGMDMIARHFVQISNRFRELATERVERRVARALLRLLRQVGRKVADGVLLDVPLSRQNLAEMTGTTLYTTSRILSQWEKQGWISTGREQVVVLEPHRLAAVAEDLPK